jgi:spermidine/putrescine transport system permease protein
MTALLIRPNAAERRAERRDAVRGLTFSAPAALYTLAFFIVPLIIIAFYSLYETAFRGLGPGPGLSNYRSFFAHDAWVDALFNSLALTLVTTAASVVLAYPIAYLLAFQVPRRWQRLALTLMVLPFWTSYIVRSYAWLLVLSPDGVINQSLMLLGVTRAPLRLAYNNAATVVGFVHFFIMLLTLTIYSNLSQLSPRYLLAASDLGAGWVQSFWYVLLPLSLPGIVSGAFMTFVLCIGDYITPQILGGDRTLVMPQEMFFQISRNADFSMASAMAVILMAVMALAYLASSRWLRMDRL